MPGEPEPPPVELRYTPEFKRNLRQLTRKYRRIKSDLQPLLDALAQGQVPGDQVPGIPYDVFNARVRNSDSAKDKSGGYRVIYQRTADGAVILITIYSKSDQADIPPRAIREIILSEEARRKLPGEEDEAATPSDEEGGGGTTPIEDSPS